MVWIWIIGGVVVVVFVFMLVGALRGTNYWKRCEIQYANLVSSGYTPEKALLWIFMERHPELSIDTHKVIIDKFNDVPLLVNFFEGALPNNVDDEFALEIMRNTTINSDTYKVRTKRIK